MTTHRTLYNRTHDSLHRRTKDKKRSYALNASSLKTRLGTPTTTTTTLRCPLRCSGLLLVVRQGVLWGNVARRTSRCGRRWCRELLGRPLCRSLQGVTQLRGTDHVRLGSEKIVHPCMDAGPLSLLLDGVLRNPSAVCEPCYATKEMVLLVSLRI